MSDGDLGPVLFAYDGSDLARLAIEEAGRQLEPGRDAVVLTIWRPYGVGFIPPNEVKFDAAAPDEVRKLPRKPPRREPRSQRRRLPRRESLARGSANVEGDCPRRRRTRREPDRARLPRQERSHRHFPRQRRGRGRGALRAYRAHRAQARLNRNDSCPKRQLPADGRRGQDALVAARKRVCASRALSSACAPSRQCGARC